MWAVFGIAAIAAAVLNLVAGANGNETKYDRFASLSLTALTVCAWYSDGARRVEGESWGTLMDIMPTMSKVLWVCVILSILINGITLLKKRKEISHGCP